MFRLFSLVMFVAFGAMACAVASESGGPSEPVVSPAIATSVAGAAAISSAAIDADTCEGVLATASAPHSLSRQSLTSSVQASEPNVESMCSAIYDTDVPGEPFLTVELVKFSSDEPAVERYEMIKDSFVQSDFAISEVNSADEGLIDQVSAWVDSDGIGRIMAMRQNGWVVTVSVGPTMAAAPWVVGDLEAIGAGVLERVR
ncbi:MAG: hypothetical protein HQ477_00310 [Chloroflexi bacterium]|nr:hypothetical protein [Chloroflexota bacterium]